MFIANVYFLNLNEGSRKYLKLVVFTKQQINIAQKTIK